MGEKAKGGKKNRKVGRNKKWCESYRARHQREKNKVVKLDRHIQTHPADNCALVRRDAMRRLARGLAA